MAKTADAGVIIEDKVEKRKAFRKTFSALDYDPSIDTTQYAKENTERVSNISKGTASTDTSSAVKQVVDKKVKPVYADSPKESSQFNELIKNHLIKAKNKVSPPEERIPESYDEFKQQEANKEIARREAKISANRKLVEENVKKIDATKKKKTDVPKAIVSSLSKVIGMVDKGKTAIVDKFQNLTAPPEAFELYKDPTIKDKYIEKIENLIPEEWGKLAEKYPAITKSKNGYEIAQSILMSAADNSGPLVATVVDPVVGYLNMFGLEKQGFEQGLKSSGIPIDKDIADDMGFYYASISSVIEQLQQISNLSKLKGSQALVEKGKKAALKTIFKRLGGMVWEGAEEFGQNTFQNIFTAIAIKKQLERTPELTQYFKEELPKTNIWSGGLESTLQGFGMGALFDIAGSVPSAVKLLKEQATDKRVGIVAGQEVIGDKAPKKKKDTGISQSVDKPKKLYRGQKPDTTGTGISQYGKGLYTTRDIKQAEKYGNVKEINSDSGYPKNPLIINTKTISFQDWLLKESGEKNIREFNKKYSDPSEFVKSKGYDGVDDGVEVVRYLEKKSVEPTDKYKIGEEFVNLVKEGKSTNPYAPESDLIIPAKYSDLVRGKGLESAEINIDNIKTRPADFKKAKNTKLTEDKFSNKPIIIDENNRIIDGHHRYLFQLNKGVEKIKAFKLVKNAEYDINSLIKISNGEKVEPLEGGKKTNLSSELIEKYGKTEKIESKDRYKIGDTVIAPRSNRKGSKDRRSKITDVIKVNNKIDKIMLDNGKSFSPDKIRFPKSKETILEKKDILSELDNPKEAYTRSNKLVKMIKTNNEVKDRIEKWYSNLFSEQYDNEVNRITTDVKELQKNTKTAPAVTENLIKGIHNDFIQNALGEILDADMSDPVIQASVYDTVNEFINPKTEEEKQYNSINPKILQRQVKTIVEDIEHTRKIDSKNTLQVKDTKGNSFIINKDDIKRKRRNFKKIKMSESETKKRAESSKKKLAKIKESAIKSIENAKSTDLTAEVGLNLSTKSYKEQQAIQKELDKKPTGDNVKRGIDEFYNQVINRESIFKDVSKEIVKAGRSDTERTKTQKFKDFIGKGEESTAKLENLPYFRFRQMMRASNIVTGIYDTKIKPFIKKVATGIDKKNMSDKLRLYMDAQRINELATTGRGDVKVPVETDKGTVIMTAKQAHTRAIAQIELLKGELGSDIKELDNMSKEYRKIASENVLDVLEWGGVINKKERQNIDNAGEAWSGLQRVLSKEEQGKIDPALLKDLPSDIGVKKKVTLKGLEKGSQQAKLDPYTILGKMVAYAQQEAQANRFKQSMGVLSTLSDKNDTTWAIDPEKTTPKFSKGKLNKPPDYDPNTQITYIQDGNYVVQNVDPLAAESIQSLTPLEFNKFQKVTKTMTGWFRKGTTTLNKNFVLVNTFVDALNAVVQGEVGAMPFLTIAAQNSKLAIDKGLMEKFLTSGAGTRFIEEIAEMKQGIPFEKMQEITQKGLVKKTIKEQTLGAFKDFGVTLKTIAETPANVSEKLNRSAAWVRVYQKAKKKGISEEASILLANEEYDRATVDFGEIGSAEWVRRSLMTRAFVNAGKNGTTQTLEKLIKGTHYGWIPKQYRTTSRGFGYAKSMALSTVLGSMVYGFSKWNSGDEERDKWFNQIPEDKKKLGFIIMSRKSPWKYSPTEFETDSTGKKVKKKIPNYWTIPLRHTVRIQYNVFRKLNEVFRDWEIKSKIDVAKDAAMALGGAIKEFSPVGSSIGEVASSLTPNYLQPVAEVVFNKNFYFWSPIERLSQQRVVKQFQKGNYSKASEILSKKLGQINAKYKDEVRSPISATQIDYLIAGYLGRASTDFLKVFNTDKKLKNFLYQTTKIVKPDLKWTKYDIENFKASLKLRGEQKDLSKTLSNPDISKEFKKEIVDQGKRKKLEAVGSQREALGEKIFGK